MQDSQNMLAERGWYHDAILVEDDAINCIEVFAKLMVLPKGRW